MFNMKITPDIEVFEASEPLEKKRGAGAGADWKKKSKGNFIFILDNWKKYYYL